MRLLTLVMQVPDSRATIRVAPDGLGIDPSSVTLVCNPFDEYAVEQAVRLKESRNDVEDVTALTVGGSTAAQARRTALAITTLVAFWFTCQWPAYSSLTAMLALAWAGNALWLP